MAPAAVSYNYVITAQSGNSQKSVRHIGTTHPMTRTQVSNTFLLNYSAPRFSRGIHLQPHLGAKWVRRKSRTHSETNLKGARDAQQTKINTYFNN